jgi:hypothetical protein
VGWLSLLIELMAYIQKLDRVLEFQRRNEHADLVNEVYRNLELVI